MPEAGTLPRNVHFLACLRFWQNSESGRTWIGGLTAVKSLFGFYVLRHFESFYIFNIVKSDTHSLTIFQVFHLGLD